MAFGSHQKLKLESDGLPQNTKLIDLETGQDLMQRYAVESLSYQMEGRELGRLTLVIMDVEASIEVDSEDIEIEEDEDDE